MKVRTTCRNVFSHYSIWATRVKLRLSGLVASALISWAISPAHHLKIQPCDLHDWPVPACINGVLPAVPFWSSPSQKSWEFFPVFRHSVHSEKLMK